MSLIFHRIALVFIVLALCLIGYAGHHLYGMKGEALRQAEQLRSGRDACWVMGHYIQGDVPTVSLVLSHQRFFELWPDFKDRFLNSEQAKPIHFGLLVPEDETYQTALFAWSYRQGVFWQVAPHNMAFISARRFEDVCGS